MKTFSRQAALVGSSTAGVAPGALTLEVSISAAGVDTYFLHKRYRELTALQADHPAVAVGFFAAAEGRGYDAFAAAALDAEAVPLAVASFAPPANAEPPAVVMYKTFDEAQVVYSGGLSKPELERWVGLESLPSTIEFLPHTVPQIFNSKHRDDDTAPKHLLLFSSSELPSVPRPSRPSEAASDSSS